MQRYTSTAIVLHWTIALLIVSGFTLGLIMTDMPGLTPTKLNYYAWHKWIGVTVLALAAVRLLWRLKNGAPAYPASMPAWQKQAAQGLHGMLYLLMFAVPLSGYFYTLAAGIPVVYLKLVKLPVLIDANPELKPVLKELHFWLVMTLAALVGAHAMAALKHLFVDRDGIMQRMLPKLR
ncbi:MAG: cytochrome b [Pseudomonadota bacterium]